jgi:hypothetical protein
MLKDKLRAHARKNLGNCGRGVNAGGAGKEAAAVEGKLTGSRSDHGARCDEGQGLHLERFARAALGLQRGSGAHRGARAAAQTRSMHPRPRRRWCCRAEQMHRGRGCEVNEGVRIFERQQEAQAPGLRGAAGTHKEGHLGRSV